MVLTDTDRRLLAVVAEGLPLVAEPYRTIGDALGLSEAEVLARLAAFTRDGPIRRFGVVVRHRELGYRANAMVVWDVPDERVEAVGEAMAKENFITLCYRRPRRPPRWPFNLFCMIHGRDRDLVRGQIADLVEALGLEAVPRAVLFSTRCFKQCGSHYFQSEWACPPRQLAEPAS